jgi:hypothetical protein
MAVTLGGGLDAEPPCHVVISKKILPDPVEEVKEEGIWSRRPFWEKGGGS